MSAVPDPILVRRSDPETLDRAAVTAIDHDGSTIGRATLSRLYGPRAEIEVEQALSPTVALALIDALEREARTRGLVRLELDVARMPDAVIAALRRWRPVATELRGSRPYLTWPTTLVNS